MIDPCVSSMSSVHGGVIAVICRHLDINCTLVVPFAANQQVGKIWGLGVREGRRLGSGGVTLGPGVDFCGAATGLASIFALLAYLYHAQSW